MSQAVNTGNIPSCAAQPGQTESVQKRHSGGPIILLEGGCFEDEKDDQASRASDDHLDENDTGGKANEVVASVSGKEKASGVTVTEAEVRMVGDADLVGEKENLVWPTEFLSLNSVESNAFVTPLKESNHVAFGVGDETEEPSPSQDIFELIEQEDVGEIVESEENSSSHTIRRRQNSLIKSASARKSSFAAPVPLTFHKAQEKSQNRVRIPTCLIIPSKSKEAQDLKKSRRDQALASKMKHIIDQFRSSDKGRNERCEDIVDNFQAQEVSQDSQEAAKSDDSHIQHSRKFSSSQVGVDKSWVDSSPTVVEDLLESLTRDGLKNRMSGELHEEEIGRGGNPSCEGLKEQEQDTSNPLRAQELRRAGKSGAGGKSVISPKEKKDAQNSELNFEDDIDDDLIALVDSLVSDYQKKKESSGKPDGFKTAAEELSMQTERSTDLPVIEPACCSKRPESDGPRPGNERFFQVEGMETLPNASKKLSLKDLESAELVEVEVGGSWAQTSLQVGDKISIASLSNKPMNELSLLDDGTSELVMVVEPDCMISATRIGDVFTCDRRAILSEMVKDSELNESAVIGNITHTVFQAMLQHGRYSEEMFTSLVEQTVEDNTVDLLSVGLSSEDAKTRLYEFRGNVEKVLSSCLDRSGSRFSLDFGRQRQQLSVGSVQDIEEMMHSRIFGIKGQVDATVEVRLHGQEPTGRSLAMLPLEIKSGKEGSIAHRAQVILYSLLLRQRYPSMHDDQRAGLLLYLKTGSLQGIPLLSPEVKGILQGRNQLAAHLKRQSVPPIISDVSKCQFCFQSQVCGILHRACEERDTSRAGKVVLENTSHLSDSHLDYVAQWERMIALEEANKKSNGRESSKIRTSVQAEHHGECYSRMLVTSSGEGQGEFLYTFVRYDCDEEFEAKFGWKRRSLLDLRLHEGDLVTARKEEERSGGKSGRIVQVRETSVVVSFQKAVVDEEQLAGDIRQGTSHYLFPPLILVTSERLWRLDKDEQSSLWSRIRFNLYKLFLPKNGDDKRRSLVVDLAAPRFGMMTVSSLVVVKAKQKRKAVYLGMQRRKNPRYSTTSKQLLSKS
eukprot:768590-Hanusia_phi.AAC.21